MTNPRRRARPQRQVGAIIQPPWRQPEFRYPPVEIISADALEAIHQASLTILETIGMRILSAEARALFAAAGAQVTGDIVRLDRGLVMEKLAQAPSSFRLHARNPARDLQVGGRHAFFSAVGGPAYVSDLAGGRRAGTHAEMCDYLRLIQSLDILHQEGGGPFEALDLPQETRHLDLHLAQITLLDKNWQPWALGRQRARDGIEMAAIMFGVPAEGLVDIPCLTVVINTNSPLQLDIPMAEGLIEMARFGQPIVVTPFTLSGAMAPVTLAGALAQQNAEALAGIVLTQCARPGNPVLYGAFTTNVDMRTGAPAFGTPEYAQAAQISGQLARRYNLPFRSSNACVANGLDAQAGYESMMSLWGALTGQAHMVMHAAGWMGGGLVASFEKLVIDADMLQMMAAWLVPPIVDDVSLGLDAIAAVGHGGHFFGTPHTLARYETAFYSPLVSDWDNHDNWRDRGSPTTAQRAAKVVEQLLAAYEPPPLDAAILEALEAYVARRKREITGR
ncbi:MAG: trimethylamine methyltransferase family protein [Geminicoccaceae bacterium]